MLWVLKRTISMSLLRAAVGFSKVVRPLNGGGRGREVDPLLLGGFGGPLPRKFCNSRWLKKRFWCTLRPFLLVNLSLFYTHYSHISNAYHNLLRLPHQPFDSSSYIGILGIWIRFFLSFSICCQTLYQVLSAGVLCTLRVAGWKPTSNHI